jgi:hypothetical protein
MNSDDYAKKQSARDAEYQREYRAWVESLPADERRQLEAKGLAAPCSPLHGNGSARGDAADSPLMREGDDPALIPDPEPEPADETCDAESVHSAIRRVVAEILCHDNARLTTECIALVSGLAYTGSSMTEIAKRHGISRAAVSKRCVELTELLDLPPSRAMRSLTARKRYRDARLRSTRSHERTHPSS